MKTKKLRRRHLKNQTAVFGRFCINLKFFLARAPSKLVSIDANGAFRKLKGRSTEIFCREEEPKVIFWPMR